MKRIAAYVLLGAALVACSDAPPPSAPAKALAPATVAYSKGGDPIADSNIVVYKDNVSDVDGESDDIAAKTGGKVKHKYRFALKGMAIELSAAKAEALASDPRVALVEQDQVMTASTVQSGATWGIDRIDQHTRPLSGTYVYNADGTGVTVYIIDTGINFSHNEYSGRAFTGIDEVPAGGTAARPE